MNILKIAAVWMAILLTATPVMAQDSPATIEDILAIVERQQAEIDALRAELEETRRGMDATAEKVAESEERIEATGDFVETLAAADSGRSGVSIGGYGELHYNQVSSDAGVVNQTHEDFDVVPPFAISKKWVNQ